MPEVKRRLVKLRTQRALNLERKYHELAEVWDDPSTLLPNIAEARVRYAWDPSDFAGAPLDEWECSGYYIRRDGGRAWELLGVNYLRALESYRAELYDLTGERRGLDPDEVKAFFTELAKVAGPLALQALLRSLLGGGSR